jgi:serine/threonine protein kinase
MKILNKKKLMAKKQLKYAVSETNILKKVSHPFIVTLHFSFQTPSNLYIALDYCPNGDLSELLC